MQRVHAEYGMLHGFGGLKELGIWKNPKREKVWRSKEEYEVQRPVKMKENAKASGWPWSIDY